MTAATSSRGRKRHREEEEETPPRPTLDDLEQEDRAQQQVTPGRAVPDQPPKVAGPYLGSEDTRHPQDQGTPPTSGQGRASPEPTAPATGAGGVQPQRGALTTSSATKRPGQNSISDYLSRAGPNTEAGISDQQQQRQNAQSPGEAFIMVLAYREQQQPSCLCKLCST